MSSPVTSSTPWSESSSSSAAGTHPIIYFISYFSEFTHRSLSAYCASLSRCEYTHSVNYISYLYNYRCLSFIAPIRKQFSMFTLVKVNNCATHNLTIYYTRTIIFRGKNSAALYSLKTHVAVRRSIN